jgi:hypothetical protein
MDKDRYGKDIQGAPSAIFLDLEDSFISRIELSRFEVVFIIPSTAAEGRKDNLPPANTRGKLSPVVAISSPACAM